MIFSKFSTTRLINEEKNMEEILSSFPKSCKISTNIRSAGPILINGMKNLYNWEAIIEGRKDTLFSGGFYPISIRFDENFPKKSPKIYFPKGFQHIHVYEDGEICLPLLNENNWSSQYDMIYVLNSIEEMIHGAPRIYSPANNKLLEVYLKNRDTYNFIIEEQARKFSDEKKELYFIEVQK